MCGFRQNDEASITTLNGKLNLPLKEKMQLRKDHLKLKQIWRLKVGSRKVQK